MKVSKKTLKAVTKRLRQYERVIESGKFEPMGSCDICATTYTICFYRRCWRCPFDGDSHFEAGCVNLYRETGVHCTSMSQIKYQYRHLLNQLEKNGYEFK